MLLPAKQSAAQPVMLTIEAMLAELGSDAVNGLSEAEALARLERDGRNELPTDAPVPWWARFFAQFRHVLVILLLCATAVSATIWFVERNSAWPYEAIAILAVVFVNAAMGFLFEARAEAAITALRAMSADASSVVRDHVRRSVPAAELVRGDIIVIDEGDTVPADARLVESTSLKTTEAALTGESLPVSKDIAPIDSIVGIGDCRNMVFSGTSATYGRGRAVVTATGMHTEVGRVAGMLKSSAHVTTPLQEQLDRVGRMLGTVVVLIALVMIGTLLVVQDVRGISGLFEVLILGVALAVAAVPEGLPAVVTVVLALGVKRMAKRNAIVRHLVAVETLGSADVIASDKTGTLTRNEMTVRVVVTASGRANLSGTGYSPEGSVSLDFVGEKASDVQAEIQAALTAADRVNNAALRMSDGLWAIQGDPTEAALIVAARKCRLDGEALDARFARLGEVPFSSERKLMTTVHSDAERQDILIAFSKGAPDVLLGRCCLERVGNGVRVLSDSRRAEIMKSNDELASSAMRTLGVATKDLPATALQPGECGESLERELTFLGLIGMLDPPREEAKQAVSRAREAGIRSIMITGDHPRTAGVIASELGIAAEGFAVTGAELDNWPEDVLVNSVRDISVFARVNPAHKLRIVKALQRSGSIVAMTGDGVNDAPALKVADIGIAMGMTGTDVAKESADIVLSDDNFATIVAAVEEGRSVFSNIRKFLRFLLSSNIGEVMTMFLGVLFAEALGLQGDGASLALPLLATQILWINLVTDGAPGLALGVEPNARGLMLRPPRPRREGVITRDMWWGIFFVGIIMATGTLLVLDASLPGGFVEGSGDMRHARTMAFTTLVLFQLFNVFNARSDEQSAFVGLFRNRWLWTAVGLSLGLHVILLQTPFLQEAFSTVQLSLSDWLGCAAVASSVLWLRELSKLAARAVVYFDR